MRLKVIIGIFVLLISACEPVFSIGKDSIKEIMISDKAIWNEGNNKFELVPMPHPFFDTAIHRILISFELNTTNKDISNQFIIIEIKKRSLQQLRIRPLIAKKILLNAASDFYIDSLEFPNHAVSGNYDFMITYFRDSLSITDIKKLPFQLLRNGTGQSEGIIFPDSSNLTTNIQTHNTFVQKYDLRQIKKNILTLAPIAKGIELKAIINVLQSDDLTILKHFFYNFWESRNVSDPEKGWNEYVIILNEVSKKYGNANTLGYETDRGRIYIQYGVPDRVERVLNEKGALPYEVWFYYHSGNKHNLKFLFFQPGRLGNQMYLLHSNVTGEMINPEWKYQLLEDPQNGDGSLTNKVFEFFK